MLPLKTTATVLYTAPSLSHLIKTYKERLNNLFSYTYNVRGIDAEILFEAIVLTMERLEALKLLNMGLNTAFSMLNERQQEFLTLYYYKGISPKKILNRMNIGIDQFKYIKECVLKKMGCNVEILGFSNQRIIECFDDVAQFIASAERVENMGKEEI